jgi:hypothetical protein
MIKILLLLLFLIIIHKKSEGYLSNNYGYMDNKSTHEEPDDTIFYACNEKVESEECNNLPETDCELNRDCIFNKGHCQAKRYPNNHYKINSNSFQKHHEGAFSSFLDVNDFKNYDHFYASPICDDSYKFESDFTNQFRDIIQEQDQIDELIDKENKLDEKSVKDPFFIYESPNNTGNQILYNDKINTKMIKTRQEMRAQNFNHLDGYDSAYDNNLN